MFKKLDGTVRALITKKIDRLAVEPRPSGVKQLQGQTETFYRVRVGDYRVVYQIAEKKLIVLIVRVGNRRDVYKKEF
jgi:mRNA interferase RelE/StbE